MSIDPAALLTELQIDPKGLGYRSQTTDGIVALLNTVGLSHETCANTAATMPEVLMAVDLGEWGKLTQPQRDYLTVVAQLPSVDLTNPAVEAKVGAIFPANGPTQQALNTLKTRPCSRAEALWGPGTTATAADVITAVALNGGVI